jgi:large subunit ribosomal protein L33
MAKASQRVVIKLKSTESPFVYTTQKNKHNSTDRLEMKKFDPVIRKHVTFKESK